VSVGELCLPLFIAHTEAGLASADSLHEASLSYIGLYIYIYIYIHLLAGAAASMLMGE